MTKPPSDQAEKIVVRLPDGMRDRLAEVAKANKRSVNAEVVARLEQSLNVPQFDDLEDPEMARETAATAISLLNDFLATPGVLSRVISRKRLEVAAKKLKKQKPDKGEGDEVD